MVRDLRVRIRSGSEINGEATRFPELPSGVDERNKLASGSI